MSAEVLRRAAALMRERARAATSGPWESIPAGAWTGRVFGDDDEMVAKTSTETPDNHGNAEHIASWHPAVAFAVADLLIEASVDWPEHPAALAVARAYLGEEADRD